MPHQKTRMNLSKLILHLEVLEKQEHSKSKASIRKETINNRFNEADTKKLKLKWIEELVLQKHKQNRKTITMSWWPYSHAVWVLSAGLALAPQVWSVSNFSGSPHYSFFFVGVSVFPFYLLALLSRILNLCVQLITRFLSFSKNWKCRSFVVREYDFELRRDWTLWLSSTRKFYGLSHFLSSKPSC